MRFSGTRPITPAAKQKMKRKRKKECKKARKQDKERKRDEYKERQTHKENRKKKKQRDIYNNLGGVRLVLEEGTERVLRMIWENRFVISTNTNRRAIYM